MSNIVLKNVVAGWDSDIPTDIYIEEGFISNFKPGEEYEVLDLQGKTVMPGLLDVHTHLEKSLTYEKVENKSGTLQEAIKNFNEFSTTMQYEDIYERGKRILDMAISHGTTGLRSHVTVNERLELDAIKPLLELKENYKEKIDLQLVAFPGAVDVLDRKKMDLLRSAIELGSDVVGGCPTLSLDHEDTTDKVFDLAAEYKLPLDLHVDESEDADARALEYLADKTLQQDWGGKVTAGHCTSLSLLPDEQAELIIEKVRQSDLNIITLPSCNLFLMGRGGSQPGRRGLTRVERFLEAGVNVALASDNIRDPFRPFGNANLLQEAILAAQVLQFGTKERFIDLLKMISSNAARIFQYSDYGLEPGCKADLVVLDAASPIEALLGQADVLYTIKQGEIVYRSE